MRVLSPESVIVAGLFLDAFSHLYKMVCPSVGSSVRLSVRPSVTHELISCKSAVFDHQYKRERILCRVSGLVPLTTAVETRVSCGAAAKHGGACKREVISRKLCKKGFPMECRGIDDGPHEVGKL